jgi:signal transduction histidine kinase
MRKILIVDDEDGVLEELSDYFAKDYEIVTAKSATEAIRLLEGLDLAIIDMFMETEESGIEVLKAAKKMMPLLQCIILTAYGTASNAVKAMKEGAYDYVEKQTPDIYEALDYKIKRALEHRDNIEALRKSEEKYRELVEDIRKTNIRLEETLAELRTTQQKMFQHERLREIGQLTSGIAHDFNNILTPILGYSDFMLDSPETLRDEKKTRQYLDMIRIAAEDGRELVNRMRLFYRKREGNEDYVTVDLNQLIQQTILITQPRWKDQSQAAGITIDILTDLQDIPLINGKENELREVLTNLIFNSVDALTTNGTISLCTQTDGKNIILRVEDSGMGMTEETIKRCFEPFFSTKGLSGTGLGLSIVHGIIQRHEGTIEVESEQGKGTTFIIHLPRATEKQGKDQVKTKKGTLHPLHILVVDDEMSILNLLHSSLTVDGHTLELANNGREGLEKFKSGKFDLVITDRAMPYMGGNQLADHIKQIAPKVPIIMITGLGNIMEASGEMPKNIDRIIDKPFRLDELRKVLIEVTVKSENGYT